MKTLLKAAVTTGVLATGLAIATPADALSFFDFRYEFDSGSVLSGVLEGEQNGDLVTVFNVTNSFFDGTDLGQKSVSSFVSTSPGSAVVSVNGSVLDFFVSNPLGSYSDATGFGAYGNEIAYGFNGESSAPDIFEEFKSSKWSLSLKPEDNDNQGSPTTAVPTPAAILPVLVGLFGAASKRKQEES